jgi:hypothetical protein
MNDVLTELYVAVEEQAPDESSSGACPFARIARAVDEVTRCDAFAKVPWKEILDCAEPSEVAMQTLDDLIREWKWRKIGHPRMLVRRRPSCATSK